MSVLTAQGPRSALKISDYVMDADLEFDLWAGSPSIKTKDLLEMFVMAQRGGLGASRSQGYGKFELKEFELIQERTRKITEGKPRKKPKTPADNQAKKD